MLLALGGGEAPGPNFPNQTSEIYSKLHCCISPYLVGIVLSYITYHSYHPIFHKVVQWSMYSVMWIVAGILCMITVHGLYETFCEQTSTLSENVAYLDAILLFLGGEASPDHLAL